MDDNNYTYGIMSIVCAIVSWFFFGIILTVLGIVFGCLGLQEGKGKPLAVVGLVLCIAEFMFLLFSLFI